MFQQRVHCLWTTFLQINLRMSFIGVAAMTAFQAMYTWPRRQALVIDLMAAQHLEPTYVVILHGVFGGEGPAAAICACLLAPGCPWSPQA